MGIELRGALQRGQVEAADLAGEGGADQNVAGGDVQFLTEQAAQVIEMGQGGGGVAVSASRRISRRWKASFHGSIRVWVRARATRRKGRPAAT